MPTLGETLREARVAKGIDTSTAAAATRLKVQVIEDLEDNNFSTIAAPVYAKGFIRLYAEYLELDPLPLIHDYLSQVGAGRAANESDGKSGDDSKKSRRAFRRKPLGRLKSDGAPRHVGPRGPRANLDDFLQLRLERMRIAFIEEPVKCSLIAFAVLVLLVFVASGLARCAGF